MPRKLLSMLALMFYGLTAVTQTNDKIRSLSSPNEGPTAVEPAIKPLFIIQGAMSKYFDDPDGILATSISLGVKYLNKFGIAANIQPTGIDDGVIDYLPVSLELSFTAESRKIRPFANMQVGHVFSKSAYSVSSGGVKITSQTKGTAFFSPGIGLLIPVKKQSGILLTCSFLNSGFKTKTMVQSTGGIVNVISRYNMSGYRIGLGYKF